MRYPNVVYVSHTPMQCINGASLSQSWYCADSAPTFISLVGPTRSRPVRLALIHIFPVNKFSDL